MVLACKRMALQVRGKDLPQVEEFQGEYLGVLFTSDGKRDCEISCRLGQSAAVMSSLHRIVVVKTELSHKAMLFVYQLVYIPILTYGLEL